MILDAYWCRVHGRRTTAVMDPQGALRCDAPAARPWRAHCELLLEPVIVPSVAEEGDEDDVESG